MYQTLTFYIPTSNAKDSSWNANRTGTEYLHSQLHCSYANIPGAAASSILLSAARSSAQDLADKRR